MAQEEDPLAANSEDADGDYWDPWQAIGLSCVSYNSVIDEQAIAVLKGICAKKAAHVIASETGLTSEHVELLQSIFCSAGWCQYGTSPRCCWITHDYGDDFGERLLSAWEAYYVRNWGEPA